MTIDNAVTFIQDSEDLPQLYDDNAPKDFDAIGRRMEEWEQMFDSSLKPHLNSDDLQMFQTALNTNKFAIALSLLQRGQKLTSTDTDGNTPLHQTFQKMKGETDPAKRKGLLAIVDQIVSLASGADALSIWSILDNPNKGPAFQTPIDLIATQDVSERYEITMQIQQKVKLVDNLANQIDDKIDRAKKVSQFQSVFDERATFKQGLETSQKTASELQSQVEKLKNIEKEKQREIEGLKQRAKKDIDSLKQQLQEAKTPPPMPGTLVAPIVPITLPVPPPAEEKTFLPLPLPDNLPPPPKNVSNTDRQWEKHLCNLCGSKTNEKENLEKLSYAITHGCSPNIQGGVKGNTGLHEAAASLNLEIVRFLVREGADTTLINDDEQTPIDCIPLKNNLSKKDQQKAVEIRKILTQPLENSKLYELIVKLKIAKNWNDTKVAEERSEVIKLIISLKTSHLLFACDSQKKNLLHHATEACWSRLVEEILKKVTFSSWDERVAYVNQVDKVDQTALHKALMREVKDNRLKLTLETLIQNGANSVMKSEAIRTPYEIAEKLYPDPIEKKDDDHKEDWEVQQREGRSTTRSDKQEKRGSSLGRGVRKVKRSLSRGRKSSKDNVERTRKETEKEQSNQSPKGGKKIVEPKDNDFSVLNILSNYTHQTVQKDNLKKYIADLIYSDLKFNEVSLTIKTIDMGRVYLEIWDKLSIFYHKYRPVFHIFNKNRTADLTAELSTLSALSSDELDTDDKVMNSLKLDEFLKNVDTTNLNETEAKIAVQKMQIYNKTARIIKNVRDCITTLMKKQHIVSEQVQTSAEERFEELSKKLYFSFIRQSQGDEAVYLLKSKDFSFIDFHIRDETTKELAIFVSMEYRPNPKEDEGSQCFGCPELFMYFLEHDKNAMNLKSTRNRNLLDSIFDADNPLVMVQIAKVKSDYKLEEHGNKLDRNNNSFVHHAILQARPDLLRRAIPAIDIFKLWNRPNRAGKIPLDYINSPQRNPYITSESWKKRIDECKKIIIEHTSPVAT